MEHSLEGKTMVASLFFPGDKPPATIHGLHKAGSIVRIAPGIYTDEVSDPVAVVLREWQAILGHMLPNSVVTDRSVLSGGPDDGVLFLARAAKARQIVLPGLVVSVRQGLGPVEGDIALPGGLFLASPLRAVLDNLLPSRAVRGKPARTLSDLELSNFVLGKFAGSDGNRLAELMGGVPRLIKVLGLHDDLIPRAELLLKRILVTDFNDDVQGVSFMGPVGVGMPNALEGPRRGVGGNSESSPNTERELLDLLHSISEGISKLQPDVFVVDESEPKWTYRPFVEAFYMSGILDGKTPNSLLLKKALRSVMLTEGGVDDSLFIRYYSLVSDRIDVTRDINTSTEFIARLRDLHSKILGGSIEAFAGMFKDESYAPVAVAAESGASISDLLSIGFESIVGLNSNLGFAIGLYILISFIRPFEFANEQVASIALNSALCSVGECRIIFPVVDDKSEFSKLLSSRGHIDSVTLINRFIARQESTVASHYQDLGLALKEIRADLAELESNPH